MLHIKKIYRCLINQLILLISILINQQILAATWSNAFFCSYGNSDGGGILYKSKALQDHIWTDNHNTNGYGDHFAFAPTELYTVDMIKAMCENFGSKCEGIAVFLTYNRTDYTSNAKWNYIVANQTWSNQSILTSITNNINPTQFNNFVLIRSPLGTNILNSQSSNPTSGTYICLRKTE